MTPSPYYLLQAEDRFVEITNEPIQLLIQFQKAHHPKAGGVVLFSGEIRNENRGKRVTHLEYEAYTSMAQKIIEEIIHDAIKKWQLNYASCIHRIGKLTISEMAVLVITAHAHRSEAYDANKYIIDRVKHEAPIWKNEFYEDGTSHWGGNCNCHP